MIHQILMDGEKRYKQFQRKHRYKEECPENDDREYLKKQIKMTIYNTNVRWND